MELGGSDAFIVLADADLEHTVKWAVWGRMYNTGQTCCAAKRFIVVDELADAFLAKFRAALAALKPGDPMDEKTALGPLSSESALLDLLKQVDGAVAHGAKVLLGGKRIDRPGSFMEPTILTDVTPENPAFREEFFGPVALFFRVKNEDEAIALANDSDFGLGGSVFTKDAATGQRVASRVETGMMFVNNISPGLMPNYRSAVSRTPVTAANSGTWAFRNSSTRSWFASVRSKRRRRWLGARHDHQGNGHRRIPGSIPPVRAWGRDEGARVSRWRKKGL